MRILLATPLYPPDTASTAAYIKELARRLHNEHQVTILAYGHIPEKVEGVRIVSISKHNPLLMRLAQFTRALIREARHADLIYAENGASIEFPLVLATVFIRTPLIIHIGDKAAHEWTANKRLRRILEKITLRQAERVVEHMPLSRPEILPLEVYPESAFAEYELSWNTHLKQLNQLFVHAP